MYTTLLHVSTLQQEQLIFVQITKVMGWDSIVNTATHYGLDGPGIKYQWGWDFPHLCRPALLPSQPSIQWVPGLFPQGKAADAGTDPSHPSSVKVIERVQLHLFYPSGPATASSRPNFTLISSHY
jgi:hypothetical protein